MSDFWPPIHTDIANSFLSLFAYCFWPDINVSLIQIAEYDGY